MTSVWQKRSLPCGRVNGCRADTKLAKAAFVIAAGRVMVVPGSRFPDEAHRLGVTFVPDLRLYESRPPTCRRAVPAGMCAPSSIDDRERLQSRSGPLASDWRDCTEGSAPEIGGAPAAAVWSTSGHVAVVLEVPAGRVRRGDRAAGGSGDGWAAGAMAPDGGCEQLFAAVPIATRRLGRDRGWQLEARARLRASGVGHSRFGAELAGRSLVRRSGPRTRQDGRKTKGRARGPPCPNSNRVTVSDRHLLLALAMRDEATKAEYAEHQPTGGRKRNDPETVNSA